MLRVTLARPDKRNAQGPRMWEALRQIGRSVPATTEVVILDALGPAFSAGLDRSLLVGEPVSGEPSLAALALLSDEALDDAISRFQEAFTWWHEGAAVSVAVVQGHAVGAGFQLALGCDLRIAATDAVFSLAEVRLGLVPDLGGTRRLHRLVGPSRTLDLAATGRPVPAVEAYRLGVADRLVEPAGLAAATAELVAELRRADPVARRAVKQLVAEAGSFSAAEQRARERAAQLPLIRRLVERSPTA